MREVRVGRDADAMDMASSEGGAEFLILGPDPASETRDRAGRRNWLARRLRKIRGQTRSMAPEVWGTLGMADRQRPPWSGTIRFSAHGNDTSIPAESSAATCREIELLRTSIPELASRRDLRVRERFVSFTDVTIHDLPTEFGLDELPVLRLTLMLKPEEGAVAYYQLHDLSGDQEDPEEVAVEYIQPNPTLGHDCTDRDRLTYEIPVRPGRKIVEKEEGVFRLDSAIRERFIVKVLTFPRDNAESGTVVARLMHHIWGHSHRLRGWNPDYRRFETIDGSEVRPDVPTLCLLHGTMSSTEQAFQGLMAKEGGWLAERHAGAGGRYPQILAFDHPTLSEDAEENALALLDRLPRGFHFEQPVDLVTHSRGGLLGKYLALHVPQIPVRRGALVACANGVGYYTAGRRIGRLLSVLKAAHWGGPGAIPMSLVTLAQHSGRFVLNLPGSRLMTPGADRLEKILESPGNQPYARFLPMAGDFHRSLVADRRLFRRWGERGLDAFLKVILGPRHDWVVGTSAQLLVHRRNRPAHWREMSRQSGFVLKARHSDYFPMSEVQERITGFLAGDP